MNHRLFFTTLFAFCLACDPGSEEHVDARSPITGKADGAPPCMDDTDCALDSWCDGVTCVPEEDLCNLVDCPPDAPVCLDGMCFPDAEDPCNLIDCPPDAPVCLDGTCVPCEGGEDDTEGGDEDPCHLIDCPPEAPVCIDGTCVPA
jgi:hypothetical protein